MSSSKRADSAIIKRLAEGAANVQTNRGKEFEELTFMAREFVQITLPHSNPGNVPVWIRRNGNRTLTIRPPYRRGECLGYPYGTIPRLLMFWVTTEAIRTKDRKLFLGDSAAEFMREIGLDPGRGGSRSDYRRLKTQMERFFRATISYEFEDGDAVSGEDGWADIQIGSKSVVWWDFKNPDQEAIFESWVELNYDFYESITQSPVPVDLRALRVLKNSALALDLYVWAAYKTYLANRRGNEGKPVTWRQLHGQFGADYGRIDNFQQKARAALEMIQAVYPGLNIEFVRGGLRIKPGKLAVSPRAELLL